MKGIGIFIAILLIAVIIYLYMLNQKAKQYAATKPGTNITNYNSGYELGLNLANLIANTKCGKEGRPPCTKAELQASGWSAQQIAAAEAGSNTVGQSVLCMQLGIGCN